MRIRIRRVPIPPPPYDEKHPNAIYPMEYETLVTVEGFDIPVSGTLTLEPGAAHIMLVGVARPLRAGDTLTISLRLQSGATIETKVEVRQGTERAPASSIAPATQEPTATPEATRTASYTDSCG